MVGVISNMVKVDTYKANWRRHHLKWWRRGLFHKYVEAWRLFEEIPVRHNDVETL